MIHQVVKAKLIVTSAVAQELKATMEEFNRACNTLAELAFQQNVHRKYDLHHAGYNLIRQETKLPSQQVINALAKVSQSYTREKDKLHQFKPHSSVRYNARTMLLGQDCYTASLTICPKGRVTGQLQMSNKARKQLRDYEFGSAELVYRKGQFYLHISVAIPTPEPTKPTGTLGVDLGVNRIAVTSNNTFHAAKFVRHKKACYKHTRRSLQANGSKSAKRALKNVSGREARFMSDVNHQISKAIVQEAKERKQRIVLEDLTGIRKTGKAKCVHDWAFAQLDFQITYKAQREGVEVIFVDPRHTSQMCHRCLHLGKRPHQSSFVCASCGHYNADLNAAKSIVVKHDLTTMGRFFCSLEQNQLTRPEVVRSSAKKRAMRNLELQSPPITGFAV